MKGAELGQDECIFVLQVESGATDICVIFRIRIQAKLLLTKIISSLSVRHKVVMKPRERNIQLAKRCISTPQTVESVQPHVT
jgi:hypothetical protein